MICSLVMLFVLLAGFRKDTHKQPDEYVLLVSLDAFRWDYPVRFSTPNLNKIAAAGVRAEHMLSSFPTVTFPNHYSIATGLYPDHHGIINNSFAAPDLGLFYRIGDRAAVENPAFYLGEPMWVTAGKQGVVTGSFFWVGSEAPIKGMHPAYWKKYDEAIPFETRIDTVVKWFGYEQSKRPHLVTLYFEEPDATSHKFGPLAPETGNVVVKLDSLIGVLRQKLSKLPYARKINLIVLSDHGMSAVSSSKYVNIRSVVPERMISSITGGNPVFLINPAEGKGDSILNLLNKTRGVKAWEKSAVPVKWHYGSNPRIPGIVVVADSSWSIGLRPDGSGLRGGAHGYDNYNSDMFSIFYATGPAFRKNYVVKDLNNVDIYNLVCNILKIKPAQNDGNPGHLKGMLR